MNGGEEDLNLPSVSLIEYSTGFSPQNSSIGWLPISSSNFNVTRALFLLYRGADVGNSKNRTVQLMTFSAVVLQRSLLSAFYTRKSPCLNKAICNQSFLHDFGETRTKLLSQVQYTGTYYCWLVPKNFRLLKTYTVTTSSLIILDD